MKASDNAFFEEYKRLDKLCSDAYACSGGVSEYIARMERKAAQGRRHTDSWDADYKKLKHVRWVRNRIAHDEGAGPFSAPEDLKFVRDFYGRMLSGRDPLTLLRKAADGNAGRKSPPAKTGKAGGGTKRAGKRKRHPWCGFLLCTALALLILYLLAVK